MAPNLSERRSLVPTVLGRRETLLENARGLQVAAAHQNLFNGRIETTLGRRDSLTLPQLCQNYMTLCVRIGKIDRLRPPLNACEQIPIATDSGTQSRYGKRTENPRAGSRTTTIQLTRHTMEKQHTVTVTKDRPILVLEAYHVEVIKDSNIRL
jgi:hypothetical protein